ncbi:MAG: hypothetical protein HY473_01105 [Candidatus Sungbacteria bacterium]|uniref:Uncharacterized protein n=1 Tax=Candidatus Sungiibacteriota bacterium TaxID=2750080 RepID=A0A932YYU3_9BACT|nr:hypothetical protein [Candidatus Sungbacteria bacterium]
MIRQDEEILRAYFRLEEAQRQRLWMQRIWRPETFDWKKRGGPPPMTATKFIRQEELEKLGFGDAHYKEMLRLEEEARAELLRLAKEHPLAPHFDRIRGLSMYLCGAFVAAGGDITRAPTVSAFWKGMGLDVLPHGLHTRGGKEVFPPGSVPRRIRGSIDVERKIPALPHVTRVGEQIRMQILRCQGRMKEFYDRFRAEVDLRHPDRAKMFNMKDALRRTQKLLYACLWQEWRVGYNLSAPQPYAFDILKHPDGGLVRISDFYEPAGSGTDSSETEPEGE